MSSLYGLVKDLIPFEILNVVLLVTFLVIIKWS